jgi:hypothetical protein
VSAASTACPGQAVRVALATLVLTCALPAPAPVAALEPRFDHRDQQGLLAELGVARDSLVVGGVTHTSDRPALRLAWSFDLSGEGDELQLGGTTRLGGWSDPEKVKLLYGLDARYRAYFGSEELKTFVEIGVWTGLASKLVVVGQAGLGLAYDPSRAWGLYVAGHFGGGFGEARVATMGVASGVQLRW